MAALGVVINRPTDEPLAEPLDRWDGLQAAPGSIFVGGPVEPDALIALALAKTPITEATEELSPVSGLVVSADLTTDPALVAATVGRRFGSFGGMQGGGPDNSRAKSTPARGWSSTPSPRDVFADEPEDLWRAVLRRQGGRLAWLATAPEDLSSN